MEKLIIYAKSTTHSILLNYDLDIKKKLIDLQTQRTKQLLLQIPMILKYGTKQKPYSKKLLICTNKDALQHIKYCATLTLIPKLNEFPIDDAYQSYLNGLSLPSQAKILKGYYMFLIDRSGSMDGTRIQKDKQSLILFLKSLLEDCTFNIISFDSDFEKMFDIAQAYNEQTLNKAIKFVQEMDGTDIYQAKDEGVYDENYTKSKNNPKTLNIFYQQMERILLKKSLIQCLKITSLKHQIKKYFNFFSNGNYKRIGKTQINILNYQALKEIGKYKIFIKSFMSTQRILLFFIDNKYTKVIDNKFYNTESIRCYRKHNLITIQVMRLQRFIQIFIKVQINFINDLILQCLLQFFQLLFTIFLMNQRSTSSFQFHPLKYHFIIILFFFPTITFIL
ncbi:unnamed protein product [Paramecium sonneborni]|uniref:VWFA domain-containing protein n=1 Tax=Paramecium sonneborni TaxID=65129 RepID=A0A8S1RV50_9CILI|nr:unnamed protein product [Paramecium sonneborni]